MAYAQPIRPNPRRGFGIAPIIVGEGVHIASGIIRGSSTGSSNANTDALAARVKAGDPSALIGLVQQGGMTSNGGWRGAPGAGADSYARGVLNSLITAGYVTGPLLDVGSWRTLPSGSPANVPSQWQLAGRANSFGDGAPAKPAGSGTSPGGMQATLGGANLTTLALIGLGAFVLSKVVK